METNNDSTSETNPREAVSVCIETAELVLGREIDEPLESGDVMLFAEAHSTQVVWCGSSHGFVSRNLPIAICAPLLARVEFMILDECSVYFPALLMVPESCSLYIGDMWNLVGELPDIRRVPSSIMSDLQMDPSRLRLPMSAGTVMTVNAAQGVTTEEAVVVNVQGCQRRRCVSHDFLL